MDTPDLSDDFAVHLDPNGPAHIVAVGYLDVATSPALLDAVVACGPREPDLVIDLRDVTFIDSSGLAALLEAHHAQSAVGGRVRLRHPSPQAKRVLAITDLTETFEVEDPSRSDLAQEHDAR